jgi:hypothetical protein
MILFETPFALLYGFLWERRPPTGLETAALAFVAMRILPYLAAHHRQP